MADKKISQLTALSAANVASATDVLAIVDTSATETKKITAKDLIDGALNGGTANGVLYLNGSKVATSGSGFTYDGTSALISGGNLRVDRSTNTSTITLGGSPSANWEGDLIFATSNNQINWRIASNRVVSGALTFTPSTATGGSTFTTPAVTIDNASNVGIGTTSPSYKLHVVGGAAIANRTTSDTAGNISLGVLSTSSVAQFGWRTDSSNNLHFDIYNGASWSAALTTSLAGNLGLGVTPSAWGSGFDAIQLGSGTILANTNSANTLLGANYFNNGTNSVYINNGFASLYQQFNSAHNWYTAPSGTAGNTITFTQAMTLDASGNLGLGATSITALGNGYTTQAVQGANGAGFRLYQSTNERGRFYADSTGAFVQSVTAIPLAFHTDSTERGRFTAGGDLLVGTTSTAFTGRVVTLQTTSASNVITAWNSATSGDNSLIGFFTDGGTGRGSITYNRVGGLVAYNTTSDYRAKDILGPVQNSGATIDALKVYEGQMKGASQSRPMLVAHEAQEHAPYAVTGEKDAVNEDGTPKFQQMDTSSLVPLLIAEIQSLRSRVAALEAK